MIALLAGFTFLALTWLGRYFAIQKFGFPAFWPAAGLVLGVLLTRAPRRWPIYIGYFAVLSVADSFFRDESLRSITAWAAGSTLGPLIGALVFSSSIGRGSRLDRVNILLSLLIAIVPAALVSGALMGFAMPEQPDPSRLIDRWLPWAAANALGSLAVLPLILAPWSRRYWREVAQPRFMEGLLALALVVFEAAIFLGPLAEWRIRTPIFEFLFVPILLWMPLRLGVPGSAISNLLLAGFAAYWADRGIGPFPVLPGRSHHLLELQTLMLTLTSLSLALALAAFERRGARNALRESEERFRRLSDNAPIGIFQAELSGRCLFVNRRWSDLAGMSSMEASGVGWVEVIHEEDQERVREEWAVATMDYSEFRSTFRLRPLHDTVTWLEMRAVPTIDENGEISTYIGTAEDITARRETEEHLVHLALHDPLTKLANRLLLLDRLTQAVARLDREKQTVAILYVDLDRFKEINDHHGHDVGDRVLTEVGRRLKKASRPTDTVGRMGGDEFVVVCPGLRDTAEALRIASRLELSLTRPFAIGVGTLRVTASIGIRLVRQRGIDPEELLRDADEAMYVAKRKGPGRSEVSVRVDSRRGFNLEEQLSTERDGESEEQDPGGTPRDARHAQLPFREGIPRRAEIP